LRQFSFSNLQENLLGLIDANFVGDPIARDYPTVPSAGLIAQHCTSSKEVERGP
jgi:hypothetical protein